MESRLQEKKTVRNFDEEWKAIREDDRKEKDEVLEKLKEDGRLCGLDGYYPELEAVKKKLREKLERLCQEYREAQARGDEYIVDGKIHNAKQKTEKTI